MKVIALNINIPFGAHDKAYREKFKFTMTISKTILKKSIRHFLFYKVIRIKEYFSSECSLVRWEEWLLPSPLKFNPWKWYVEILNEHVLWSCRATFIMTISILPTFPMEYCGNTPRGFLWIYWVTVSNVVNHMKKKI